MRAGRLLLPILILFLSVNCFAVLFNSRLISWGFDQSVLIFGNLLIFCLTLLSFWILYKGLRAPGTYAFIRSVYGSFILKLLAGAGVVVIYAWTAKSGVNKPSVFTCLFLYLIYTFIEVNVLMKLAKPKRNANTGSTPSGLK